jgi:hypothetical protein
MPPKHPISSTYNKIIYPFVSSVISGTSKNPVKPIYPMKILLLLVSLFVSVITTNATTYYISTTGNDATGNGSAGNPWKTLYKATASVTATGDIIHVNAGTYVETQKCILAVGVSIEGDGVTSIIKSTLSAVWTPLLDMASAAEGTNGNQHISNLKFDGQMTTQWGILIAGRSNVSIHDCTIVDFFDRGVIFTGKLNLIEGAATIYATGNTFYNNTVKNCADYSAGFGRGCLNIASQTGMLIHDNYIEQKGRPQGQNGWPIKYCNTGHFKGLKIYNNTLIKNKFRANYPGGEDWCFSLELWNVEGGCEIYNNYSEGAFDLAYNTKTTYPWSYWVHDNILDQPTLNDKVQDGIVLERGCEGAIIERNIVNNSASAVLIQVEQFPGLNPNNNYQDVIIRNNLFSNMGCIGRPEIVRAIELIENENGPTITLNNLQIINNTITCASTNSGLIGIYLNPGGITGTMSNINISNNIFTGFSFEWFRLANVNAVVNTLSLKNNNTYSNGNNNNPTFVNAVPANYTRSGEIHAAPMFVSSTDFHLQAGSPCIDAGINVGLPYSGSAPDIGYAEYSSGAGNIPPTANAGVNQTIALPTNSINLAGSGNDPDGTILLYSWTKISGPAGGVITNPLSASTSVTALNVTGTYQFELKVTDNGGATGKDTMEVTVNPDPNIAPTANAGPDQTITLPTSTVNLTGTGTDTDGTITSYLWTKISGPAGTVITNPSSASTTVTGFSIQGVYKFELRVTDNNGAVGRDTMQITVNPDPNIAPTANAGSDQTISFPTNSVSLAGSGNDSDGTIASYLWTKISGPAGTVITNPSSASTNVTGFTIKGVYTFELKVTDNNGAVGKDTMQVTLANVAPTANAGADQTINLPTSTVNLTGSGNDVDGTIASYLWTKVSGPAGTTITSPSSASTTVTGFSIQGVYKFELKVTDNNGAVGRDTMQITVNPDPNIAPTANAGPDQTITLPTSTVNLTGTGTDTDGTITSYLWTKISGPAGTVITNPSSASTTVTGFSIQGVYKFELRVTDNNGAVGRDTMQITVNPDPNIAPTANAGSDQTITLPTNSVNLTGSGNDPDGTITSYLWTKVSGPAAVINNTNAAATTVTGLIQGVYTFELKVTDNNGAVGRDTMQVTVNAAPNIAPTANAGLDQTITLPTNSVNLTGSGNDPDGTITSYLWTKISGPAGAITNANAATTAVTGLVQGVYKFELRVTDNNGAVGRDTMQITVNPDPNIAPTANAGADQSITLPTNTVTVSGSGNDPDGTIASYLWTKIAGPGGGGGVITNPNAASTSITGFIQGIYKFELRVTDNNGAVGRDTMQVVVFAPNVAPTSNAGLNQSMTLPTNTTTLNGSGNDIDGTITAYKWTKIAGPITFTIANSTAAVTNITGLVAGVYLFELQVTDNSGAIGKDTVQVTVNAENIPPVANAGPDQFVTLPTNTVTLSGSGTDVDGTIVAYAWKQLSGPVDKLTSLNTAVTVLNNLVEGIYTFELTVTDNRGAIDKDSVMVTLLPATFAAQNTAKIYPNPVVDITTLQINTTNNVTTMLVVVNDAQGKMVYQKQITASNGNTKERIDMSRFAGGNYFVTVYFDGQQKQTLQIVKR